MLSHSTCDFAIKFWDNFRALTGIKLPKLCPRTWTRDLLENEFCRDEDRGVIMCGLWSLRRSRNDRRHGKRPIDPGAAIDWTLEVCCHLANFKPSKATVQTEPWQPPESGVLKIMWTGFLIGTHTQVQQEQFCVIIMEHSGQLRLGSWTRWILRS
jgi:hypothetical protein